MTEAPATVLVADDSDAKRYLLASWLRGAGHKVVEAVTGQEALDRLGGIDLAVLDVLLPDLSGTEVCDRIKADPATAAIPVIQVSAVATAVTDRAYGLNEGADAYLAEPFQAEEFLATVTATLRYYRARRRAERMATRLTALTRVTLAVNAAETFDRLARTAAEGAAQVFGAPAALMLVLPEGQLRRFQAGPGTAVLQQGGPLALADTLAARVLPGGGAGRTPGLGAAATAAAWGGGAITVIGGEEWRHLVPDTILPGAAAVAVCRAKPGRAPVVLAVAAEALTGQEEEQILRQLAQSAALAVEALRAYADEHLVALTLQRSLLPLALPEVAGARLCARYVPASDQAEIGGDFYEVIERDGVLMAAIGDVQGHSLHAATVMGELRHALRAYAAEGHPPEAIARLLNAVLRRYHPDIVATLCLASLTVATGEVEIVNCGHIPPLLISGGQGAYYGQGGMLLGTPVDYPHVTPAVLPPGGTLLLVTDGLIEDRASMLDDNLELLRQAAAGGRRAEGLDELADRILALFGAREDDVALLALRRPEVPASPRENHE
jgi:serine phosphatase RsbU (regulator of sigma subunit)/DNA-binding response OmpR family regulator